MQLKPVYIFTGFLDSGKTTSIKNTLKDPRFTENEKTLILAFEQGDIEYDDKFLKDTRSVVEYLDFKDLNPELMKKLDEKHNPDRIFVELNGMDNGAEFFRKGMIKGLDIAQVLTIVDGSKFRVNMNNLKQFFYNHIAISELVIINRIDDQDLRYFRNNLKGINQRVDIMYEDSNGNVTNKINDNYFDVTKPLVISDSDFGIWYMDALDNPGKYENVDITINSYYVRDDEENKNIKACGRKAMVCCSNDLQDILFPVYSEKDVDLELNEYYQFHGVIHPVNTSDGQVLCVLYLNDYKKIKEPDDNLVTFS